MEVDARAFTQRSTALLDRVEACESITITRNGAAVARIAPAHDCVPPYPTAPIGDIELPEFDLGDPMSNDELDEALRGTGE